MGSEMSTYRIIDYVRRATSYVAVFSYRGAEHQVQVQATLNTDGTVHVEHTKNNISRSIIAAREDIDRQTPSNAGSLIGSTFDVNENPGDPIVTDPVDAEEL